jgi:hypothetical protein
MNWLISGYDEIPSFLISNAQAATNARARPGKLTYCLVQLLEYVSPQRGAIWHQVSRNDGERL